MSVACKSCGFENDSTRVLCHSCGVKLGPSLKTKVPSSGTIHPTDVAKMSGPTATSPSSKGSFGKVLLWCLLVVFMIVVIAAFLPPEAVPPSVPTDRGLARRWTALVTSASTAGSVRAFALPAADLNTWLVSTVKLQPVEGDLRLQPERVYAVAENGRIRVGLEVALPAAGRIYLEGVYVPVRQSGKYVLEPNLFRLGRLPLPGFLGWPVQRQFDALSQALALPLAPFAGASYIGIDPDTITLRWGGTGG